MTGIIDTHDNQKDFDNKLAEKNPGPYVGRVKYVEDPLNMGRLGVNIPELSKTDDPTAEQVIWCQYLSPFYGTKSGDALSGNDEADFKDAGHSYGFWAIPPDIDTDVLVIFAKGEASRQNAFWIGCIQQPLTNKTIPGYGADTYHRASTGTTPGADEQSTPRERQILRNTGVDAPNYGTDVLPVGERNRASVNNATTLAGAKNIRFPVNKIQAEQLLEQGLIQDTTRGTTTSSARRESPSAVFGFNTPGRIRPDSRQKPIGIGGQNVATDRLPGHSFVMDDGDANGVNQQIRLKSASGHQILMNDTEGVIYIANKSGNSWIEMSDEGKIYIYAQDGFNLRSDGNFDLHSGSDINFHAKNDIKFTAEGNVINNADSYLMNMGRQGIFNSSQAGVIGDYALQGITAYTGGNVLIGAGSAPEPPQNPNQRAGANASRGGGQIHLAGPQVHFNSIKAQKTWGPSWLSPERVGIVTDDSQNDVNITVDDGGLLEANTKKTKTTVPNLVTHEPFTRAPSAIIETVSQWEDPVKWKELSETPGTLEYMAMQNRKSPIESIKNLQYLADSKKFLANNGGTTKQLEKANALLSNFKKSYNKIYNVSTVLPNLSKDNLRNLIVNKVTAGRITSISDISRFVGGGNINSLIGGDIGTVARSFVQGFKSRGLISQVPPSLRGTFKGNLLQIGSQLKAGIARAFTSFFSDVRLKENISHVGVSDAGINIYRFKYKGVDGVFEGVMANEVPWATTLSENGYYMVDYSKVDVDFRRIN